MDKLEFYKKCYEDCKNIIKSINEDPDFDDETKERLTDHFLDLMNKYQRYIDYMILNG